MKTKTLLVRIGILVSLCAGMIVAPYRGNQSVQAQGLTPAYLKIEQNSLIPDVINTSRRTSGLEVTRITFTNSGNKDIEVLMPRFFASADDPAFQLKDNIDGAHLRISTGREVDIAKSAMDEAHYLTFNTAFGVNAFSSTTLSLTVDIAENPQVKSLGFDLDFNSPDFIIKYFKYDSSEQYDQLAPFYLTEDIVVKVCIVGSSLCPDLHTSNDYDQHMASLRQNDGYDGPIYSPYIPEGGMIRAKGDIDVYIVKYSHGKRFKRLILSPSVFKSYGHLKWADVKDVERAVLDSYATSAYAYVAGDSTIWRLEPKGDNGMRRNFLAPGISSWGYDPDGVYEINATDRNSYVPGPDIVS